MSSDDEDSVIKNFLGDEPRAAEWRAMRKALVERLAALRKTLQAEAEAGAEPVRLRTLDSRITAMKKQAAALETEEAISRFVEDSLLVTIAKAMPEEIEE